MRFRAALLPLACAALAFNAAAQQPRPQQQQPAQPSAQDQAWYGNQLTELAEVLGGTHYLRILCGGRADQRWREFMLGIIQRERQYEAQLVESFNRGYRSEETRFSTCDTTAEQTEAELRARGLRVSQGLSARHAPR